METKNKIEAEILTETTDFLPSDGAPCCASWISGDKPDTPKGSSTLMWVTMRHKPSGELSVGVMTYHHEYVMGCSDMCAPPDCAVPHDPEEDGYSEKYEWTCWSHGSCDHCETEWMWSCHYSEIIAHAPVVMPAPFILHNVELMRGRNNQ